MCAAADCFVDLAGKVFDPESHRSLIEVLARYKSAGFHRETPPGPSEYEGADVCRVFPPE